MSRAGAAAIQERQQQRLDDIITFARAHSPFYRELYAHLPEDIADLSVLPPVTKPQLMERFDDVLTDRAVKRQDVDRFVADPKNIGRLFHDKYLATTTSGTSGHPGIFVADEFTRSVSGVIQRIRGGLMSWYGVGGALKFVLSGRHYALLDLVGGPYAGAATIELLRRQQPNVDRWLRLVNVLHSVDSQVAELNAFQPRALGGYPSSILLLAREQVAGRLRVRPMFIIFTGETVTPADREFIEKAFACRSYEVYGSTEHGICAVQCREGWLHYSADWFVLEPVDKDYRAVPAGTFSHTVLITNLMNRLMPLIRYDQGDSILLKPEPCGCGSAFPAMRCFGRANDLLDLPARDSCGTVSVAPLNLVTVIEETPGVYRIQVIHAAPNEIDVRLQTLPDTTPDAVWPALVRRVRTYFEEQGIGEVELNLSTEPPKQNPRSGKYQQVIKEFAGL